MVSVNEEYFNILKDQGNLQKIQNVIDESGGEAVFRFEEYLWKAVNGEINLNLESILEMLGNIAFSGLNSGMDELIRIMGIALIAAVFTNFSFSFREANIADTAFYVSYVLLYGILAKTFYGAYEITLDVVQHITDFMKVLAPSYCIAIVLGCGSVTSMQWYETVMLSVTLAEYVILKLILPLIGMHMMVNLASNLSRENMLSKLCEILEMIVGWGLKTITVVVIGITGIRGMLAPAIDRVKRTTLIKSAGSIPGIGNAIDGINESLLGAGVLLKEAFGTGGMIAIMIISGIPLVRLAIYTFLYKAEAAVIQPVSDTRIVNCINAASKACAMMLKTVFAAATLFIIAIALVSNSCD